MQRLRSKREFRVLLYYTGLVAAAKVLVAETHSQIVSLDAARTATLRLKIPAQGRDWVLFQQVPENN